MPVPSTAWAGITRAGGSLEEALTELETGRADAVVVLENDLHHASATRVNAALAKAPLVMVVDHQRTAIMLENAHLVLSAASFAEATQAGDQQLMPRPTFLPGSPLLITTAKTVMLESWRWLHSLHSTLLSREVDWTQLDHVIHAVAAIWQLAGIKDAAPDATFPYSWAKTGPAPAPLWSQRQCAPISAFMSRVSRRILTPCSPSRWKAATQPTAHRSGLPFAWVLGAATPRRRGTNSRTKWAAKLRFGDPGASV